MAALYEIGERYRNLEALLEDETVPWEAVREAAAAVEDEFRAKVEAMGRMMLNMAAQIKAYQEEESRLSKRRGALERRLAGMKGYVMQEMERAGLTRVQGTVPVRVQASAPHLVVDNPALLPRECFVPLEPLLDKAAVRARLKAGESLPGAHLEAGKHLRVG